MIRKLRQFNQELKKRFASVDAYFDRAENFRVWKDTMERAYCIENVDPVLRILTKEKIGELNKQLNNNKININKGE